MNNITPIPANIITTQLAIAFIHFYRNEDIVVIIGHYGDLITGEHEVIRLETDFETLNILLQAEINAGNETAADVADQIAGTLINAGEDTEEQVETWEQSLVIDNLIFSLATLFERDEDDNFFLPGKDDRSYMINGYTLRKNIIAAFDEDLPPPAELPAYYHSILAARYALYLAMLSRYDDATARDRAELEDPAVFAIAGLEYKKIIE
jgi:hypothetical protein